MTNPNKKPTLMQLKNVCSNLIKHVDQLYTYLNALDRTMTEYINFKNDTPEFDNYCKKIVEDNKKEKKDVVLPDGKSKKTDGNLQSK